MIKRGRVEAEFREWPPNADNGRSDVCRRDSDAGSGVGYSVRTTRGFSLPSSAAQCSCPTDRPAHQELHSTIVVQTCRRISASDAMPSLDELATAAGFSRFHFLRIFKGVIGLTPHAYASAVRAHRVRSALAAGASVTTAMLGAGFRSTGHFYAASPEILGMTPTAYRSGGAGEHVHHHLGRCSWGLVMVAGTDRGLCVVSAGSSEDRSVELLQERLPHARLVQEPWFTESATGAVAAADRVFRSRQLPLDVRLISLEYSIRQSFVRMSKDRSP